MAIMIMRTRVKLMLKMVMMKMEVVRMKVTMKVMKIMMKMMMLLLRMMLKMMRMEMVMKIMDRMLPALGRGWMECIHQDGPSGRTLANCLKQLICRSSKLRFHGCYITSEEVHSTLFYPSVIILSLSIPPTSVFPNYCISTYCIYISFCDALACDVTMFLLQSVFSRAT
ncbi:hypothetical protein EV426DRAFT_416345 [Tirmania nivea]|nr:hypothetical protein EV426DRAFT_416345 [Tirmania nivea]